MLRTKKQEEIRKRIDDPQRAEYMAEQIFGPRGKLSGAKKWGRLALENLPASMYGPGGAGPEGQLHMAIMVPIPSKNGQDNGQIPYH